MNYKVNIVLDNEMWVTTKSMDSWQEMFEKFLKKIMPIKLPHTKKTVEVTVCLTNDFYIKFLNDAFRHKDSVTNVLSFPQYEKTDIGSIDTICKDDTISLGDMAMSYDQIMRESKEFNVDFFDRCCHLFTHSVLHILGMDHMQSSDEKEMEDLEIDILKSFGIKNPYIL